jgi:hypothetical protein
MLNTHTYQTVVIHTTGDFVLEIRQADSGTVFSDTHSCALARTETFHYCAVRKQITHTYKLKITYRNSIWVDGFILNINAPTNAPPHTVNDMQI